MRNVRDVIVAHVGDHDPAGGEQIARVRGDDGGHAGPGHLTTGVGGESIDLETMLAGTTLPVQLRVKAVDFVA